MSSSLANISYSEADLVFLRSSRAVRQRANQILKLAQDGKTHFIVHFDRLESVADFVLEVTYQNYPDLKIPFHSRWGHFQAGKVDRLKLLEERLQFLSPAEKTKAKMDLVLISVLLDAGSGLSWKYVEAPISAVGRPVVYSRSEGLAIASFHMFLEGSFSSDPSNPYQVDAEGLLRLSKEALGKGFQVSNANPLTGLEGRLALMHNLSKTLVAQKAYFGERMPRPGNLLDYFKKSADQNGTITASEILTCLLIGLGSIWPEGMYKRVCLGGQNLGDVWDYPLLENENTVSRFVPFHKLSQWLAYSLIEPLQDHGLKIIAIWELTGLAEYRNGGLILDSGLIELRDPNNVPRIHRLDSELVIEWRALTVACLDQIAQCVRAKLGKTEEEFPLGKVLEGGTWWAGRKIAANLRPNGAPPLRIESDGTVF